MKMIVVLLLAVSMVSVASANLLELSVEDMSIGLGGVTTVEIVAKADYALTDAQDWRINVTTAGSLSFPVASTIAGAAIRSYAEPGGYWGITAGAIKRGDVLYTMNLTGVSAGDAQITLYKISGIEDSETVTVNVTPEPMTMALLALGGLFIRRRK